MYIRSAADPAEPLRYMAGDLFQMFDAGAEDDVFAVGVGHVFLKDDVQPLGLFQCASEGVEAFLRRVAHGAVFCPLDTGLVFLQIFLA